MKSSGFQIVFPDVRRTERERLVPQKHLRRIDHSLKRLQTDYLDLYIIHRWDYGTPIEETMEALHDLVKMGKVRYIGASSMHAWRKIRGPIHRRKERLDEICFHAEPVQSALPGREEREMIPLLRDRKVAMTPWSPLAGGRLTRDNGAYSPHRQAVGKSACIHCGIRQ